MNTNIQFEEISEAVMKLTILSENLSYQESYEAIQMWAVTSYESSQMILKITFQDPILISNSTPKD
jgi:hypothetical protein